MGPCRVAPAAVAAAAAVVSAAAAWGMAGLPAAAAATPVAAWCIAGAAAAWAGASCRLHTAWPGLQHTRSHGSAARGSARSGPAA